MVTGAGGWLKQAAWVALTASSGRTSRVSGPGFGASRLLAALGHSQKGESVRLSPLLFLAHLHRLDYLDVSANVYGSAGIAAFEEPSVRTRIRHLDDIPF
jgi:hypothetical protein